MNPEMDDDMMERMSDTVANLAEAESDTAKNAARAISDNIFQKGMLFRDALGVGPERAELVYIEAYQMYQTGRYRDAQRVFTSLVMMNPFEYKYLFGVASCSHMLEEYEAAAKFYMQSVMLDKDNPLPYFHASDCHLHLKDELSAIICLRMCVDLCNNKPEFSSVKEKAEMTLSSHPIEKLDLGLTDEDIAEMRAFTQSAKEEEKKP